MGRIAIVSDIHGNRTAFAAVLKDLKWTAPDVILQGGDLADSGNSPVEIVDQTRALRSTADAVVLKRTAPRNKIGRNGGGYRQLLETDVPRRRPGDNVAHQ